MQGKLNRIFICFLLSIVSVCVYAQDINVASKLDTNNIRIGEQVALTLIAKYPKGNKVQFPVLKDTINGKIDIVNSGKLDTTINEDGTITNTLRYVITSFDSGYWAIAPFTFYVNNDSTKKYETQALLLNVATVAVDTSKEIKAIKGPLDAPFTFKEAIPYILGGLGIVAILVLAYYLFKKYRKQKPTIEAPVVPSRPLHEIALEKLKSIEEQKLWQNQMIKEYYSAVSDTLREYIEATYRINALEQTTDQTKRSFRHITTLSQESKSQLFQVLELSDMVKFAKENPIQQEHEMIMSNAVKFIYESITPLTPQNDKA